MNNTPDFIVIGSGSAGSALAYRLSESGRHSVVVLECGGTDLGPWVQMPAALSYPMNMSCYDWGYKAEPEAALGGRSLVCPRGRVIGGSSSINGMIYVRGHAGDYDHWRDELGAAGWGYKDVLPYFQRLEHSHGGEAGWRGDSGPLHITRGPRDNPLHAAFVEAGVEAGYAETQDHNGERQEGLGAAEMTVWRGRRWSTANAYLRPALKRGNVRLITRAFVERIEFSGRRAVAVRYSRRGRSLRLEAGREIVLAAGSINSPKLLMLSGVGPAEHLRDQGIEVVADRPGVGQNLQDHLEVYLQFRCLQPVTLYSQLNLFRKGLIGARWLFFKSGLGASNQFETLGFIRSAAGVSYPDVQFHFLPAAMRYDGRSAFAGHGFQVHTGPMRSPSRGWVKLRSRDPRTAPKIRFNYMSCDQDWVDFRRCIRLAREIVAQPAMAAFKGEEIQPGEAALEDGALDEFVAAHAESAYHPCGTAKLGDAKDPMAVVDPLNRVIGVEGLRLADSSIFPRITNGNLNGPSIMAGEKASDHILGKAPLVAEERTPWFHPGWLEGQR